MQEVNLETKVSLRQAYLVMFEYLNRYWHTHGKPGEIGFILGQLSLWDSQDGKFPMDATIFPDWLNCAKKVLGDENLSTGYRDADVQL